jgi:transglutaminase-like putative cysteine protease
MQYQVTAGALKAGAGAIFGGLVFLNAYPTLYKWELLPFVKTEAYRRKAALMDYSNMDGIIYDSYEKGTEAPRSEMLPTSRGQVII